jgi:hypothetical protein
MRTEEAIMRDVALLSDEERSPREIAKSLDIMERERRVNKGADDLLAGRIDSATWRHIMDLYGPDYLAAAKALVELKARRGELLPK